MNFRTAILDEIKGDPKRRKLAASLGKVDGKFGPLKKLAWSMLEHRVRDEFDIPADADWSDEQSLGVDWNTILAFLEKILPIILKLLGL